MCGLFSFIGAHLEWIFPNSHSSWLGMTTPNFQEPYQVNGDSPFVNDWRDETVSDMDGENYFYFDSFKMMALRNKNLIPFLSHEVRERRTKSHHEMHFNEIETRLSMPSSPKEPLLFTTTVNILDVALNSLTYYTGFVAGQCSGFSVDSLPNTFSVFKNVAYTFEEMTRKEI